MAPLKFVICSGVRLALGTSPNGNVVMLSRFNVTVDRPEKVGIGAGVVTNKIC